VSAPSLFATRPLTAAPSAGGIKTDDVPDVVMLLLLVGSDPSTSLATEIDVTTAIDVIYGALGPGSDIMAAEAAAFAKLFGFAAALAPANKARLFAFLAGSHPRTRRTARCLAHRLLAAAHTRCSVQDNYAHLPPLTDLYDLLSPSVGPFAIHESTDYEHMCSYVDILAVALSDIDDYVAQERREPPANPLDIIRAAIDAVHARIGLSHSITYTHSYSSLS
jgi:hypothetical protein